MLSIFALSSCSLKKTDVNPRTISVIGTGNCDAENEKAIISLSVITRNNDVIVASDENAKKMQDVQNAITELGINKDNIVTTDFYLNQETSFVNGRTVLGQYLVSNSIKITIPSIEKTGEIISVATKAGANRFDSISFFSPNTEESEKQARILALRNAEQKAFTLASSSGCSLGKVLSIKENSVSSYRKKAVLATADNAAPISGGKTSVSVELEVVYELQ